MRLFEFLDGFNGALKSFDYFVVTFTHLIVLDYIQLNCNESYFEIMTVVYDCVIKQRQYFLHHRALELMDLPICLNWIELNRYCCNLEIVMETYYGVM